MKISESNSLKLFDPDNNPSNDRGLIVILRKLILIYGEEPEMANALEGIKKYRQQRLSESSFISLKYTTVCTHAIIQK
jgi:hypothetical protein